VVLMLYWALAGRVREHGYFRALQFLPYLTRNARYDRFAGRCIYFRYKLTSGGTNLNTIEELNLKKWLYTPFALWNFYRSTRMHSANYAVARCLSVRPSHSGIVSKWLYISSKFFNFFYLPTGRPTILVFPH